MCDDSVVAGTWKSLCLSQDRLHER